MGGGTAGEARVLWTTCFGLKPLYQPELDPQAGSVSSVAVDINTQGDVVGSTDVTLRSSGNTTHRATIWKAWSNEWVEIMPSSYHLDTRAAAINDKGAVAGTQGNYGSRGGPPERFPFFWTAEGGLVPIPVAVGTRWGDASDVNNMDEVVGSSRDTINSQLHAWVWRKETGTERLPEMGQASSTAIAINDWGDIIGTVGNQPVVWTCPENAHRWR